MPLLSRDGRRGLGRPCATGQRRRGPLGAPELRPVARGRLRDGQRGADERGRGAEAECGVRVPPLRGVGRQRQVFQAPLFGALSSGLRHQGELCLFQE